MADFAPITIEDGQATPVSHTFQPTSDENRTLFWRENKSGVNVLGQGCATLRVTQPEQNNGLGVMQAALWLPYLETATGGLDGYTAPPKEAYRNKFVATCFLHARSTETQRKDLRILWMALWANSQFAEAVDKFLRPR